MLRLHSSHGISHDIIEIESGKENKLKCTLCSNGVAKRNTSFMCSICMVPLCTNTFKNDKKDVVTCFTKWHMNEDLERTSERCQKKLHDYYCRNQNLRKKMKCNLPAVPVFMKKGLHLKNNLVDKNNSDNSVIPPDSEKTITLPLFTPASRKKDLVTPKKLDVVVDDNKNTPSTLGRSVNTRSSQKKKVHELEQKKR